MPHKKGHVCCDLNTAEEKQEANRLARASNMTLAQWLRATVHMALKRKAKFSITYKEITHE